MVLPVVSLAEQIDPENSSVPISIQLIRHATLLIQLGQYKLLVYPILSPKDVLDPVKNARSTDRIPMVDLPFGDAALQQLIEDVDAVLVTHTYRDHWDSRTQHLIPKNKPIVCQPADVVTIRQQQFENVTSFDQLIWNDVTFFRTGGQHGTGEVGKQMGIVSGIIIQYKSELMYIVYSWRHDIVREVKDALQTYHPRWIVLNAGAAQFL